MARRRFSELTTQALCLGHEEDIFPVNGRPRSGELRKKGCPECPIREACLQWALDSPYEPYGMWGGYAQDEVRAMWMSRHPGNTSLTDRMVGLEAS